MPIGDDGNVEAFSFQQVQASESFIGLLTQNLPPAAGSIRQALLPLRNRLRAALRAAQVGSGGGFCATTWKELLAPTMIAIEELGKEVFSGVASTCTSDTCRLWTLLHMLSVEGLRCSTSDRVGCAHDGVLSTGAFLTAVRAFIDQYFKCAACRRHFLERFDAGVYGQSKARQSHAELVLYFWRFHNAVSTRLMAEHSCEHVDRRWPPLSICPACWDVGAEEEWDVLEEAAGRSLRMNARPLDSEVLQFLVAKFGDEDIPTMFVLAN